MLADASRTAAAGTTPSRAAPRLVSVVLPARNAEAHLAEQLAALERQTYRGAWELVVVDNGCSDGTVGVVEEWRPRLPEVRVAVAPRRGLNRARNAGADAARGELLAFCDADDVVSDGWLAALVAAAREGDVVGGTLDADGLNGPSVRAWRPSTSRSSLEPKHGFLPHAPGGNCAIWRDVAAAVRWDERFRFGSSDVEFSWRAQLAGYRLVHAEDAVVQQRFRPSQRATARQYFVYGRSDAQLYSRFAAHGMARSDVRDALRTWRRLLRTRDRGGPWLSQVARRCGRVVGSVRWRVLFL